MIDAWLIALDRVNEEDIALLSEEERQRAQAFHAGHDRQRFVRRRAGLRRVLASYLDADPGVLAFTPTDHGKPMLIDGDGLQFSLSRSGDIALVAVTRDRAVGCDIEQHAPRLACPDIANRYFARAEIAQLAELEGRAWRDGFFACWTRKEAYVKALGLGLSHPLDTFAVTVGTEGAPRLLAGAAGWSFAAVAPVPGHHLAIAIQGRSPREAIEPRWLNEVDGIQALAA